MGTPKQLLKWKQSTLIESVIKTVVDSESSTNIVVLGAHADVISSKTERFSIKTIHSKNWGKGLGNSIAYGVKYIMEQENVDGVLIVLGDQPLITTQFLNDIIFKFIEGEKCIIATQYPNEKLGVPVLFDKCYFDELLTLDDDKGAKALITKYQQKAQQVQGHDLILDIDTEADYERVYKMYH